MTQKYATEREVLAAARQWSDEVLRCRTYGHNWQPRNAVINRRHKFIYVEQECSTCHTVRHQEMSMRGAVYAQWYTYIDGYLLDGVGRIAGEGRDAVRISTVMRTYNATTDSSNEPRSSNTRQVIEEG